MKTQQNHTIIIGGGIVGASLAIKLIQAKLPVTLIDAKQPITPQQWQDKLTKKDTRVYALNSASLNLLTDIGVWHIVEKMNRKVDYNQMHVWQTNGIGDLKFGDNQTLGSMVEPMVLQYALYQRLQQIQADKQYSNLLSHICGQPVIDIQSIASSDNTTNHQITLNNQQQITGNLLIGADGRQSLVRTQAGIGLNTLNYQQTAICCAIRTEKPHHHTARQAMLPTGTLALLPLADLPQVHRAGNLSNSNLSHTNLSNSNLSNTNSSDASNLSDIAKQTGHWQSVVWTLPTYQAIDLLTHDDHHIAKELAFASSYELGKVLDIESISSFSLSAQQAKTYIKPHIALVGDAAHGVHPLAGQGLNLGMLDIIALSDILLHDYQRSCLNNNPQWGHWHSLKKYQRTRKLNNDIMMHSFSMLNWLFAGTITQQAPFQHIRSEGMSWVGKQRRLMKWFTHQASGL